MAHYLGLAVRGADGRVISGLAQKIDIPETMLVSTIPNCVGGGVWVRVCVWSNTIGTSRSIKPAIPLNEKLPLHSPRPVLFY